MRFDIGSTRGTLGKPLFDRHKEKKLLKQKKSRDWRDPSKKQCLPMQDLHSNLPDPLHTWYQKPNLRLSEFSVDAKLVVLVPL
jgi:hypothetical protein